MELISEMLSRGLEQLFGRASGPFYLRLVITPIVAIGFAIRAGMKDARSGLPPFLWELCTNPAERQRLIRSGWKDIGTMVIVALLIDIVYQCSMLHAFYVFQALILVVVLAVGPYVLVRGIATRISRRLRRKHTEPSEKPASGRAEDADAR